MRPIHQLRYLDESAHIGEHDAVALSSAQGNEFPVLGADLVDLVRVFFVGEER
jgi:hypothetical protein